MPYQRITNNYMNDSVLKNLIANRSTLIDLQNKISSGKNIEKCSDNVSNAITVLTSDSSLNKINTYLGNISTASAELETADTAVSSAIDSVSKAKELVVQGLNITAGTDQLNILGSQIDQIINQVKDIGNTKYGTKYIFGGKNTDSPTFTTPADGQIQYNGSPNGTGDREVEISDGVTIPVNLSGDSVFGYYYEDPNNPGTYLQQGLISTLTNLRDELNSANPDKEAIRQNLDNLNGNLATILNAQSTIGGSLTRLDITKTIHENSQISLTQAKSGAQDIDLAKTISDLQAQETALQASLQVSAKIIQPSLMDYL